MIHFLSYLRNPAEYLFISLPTSELTERPEFRNNLQCIVYVTENYCIVANVSLQKKSS